ncbi:MAG: ribosome small subunit-dependent GTPase A [Oscillospiraceae bacterium]|jgi:ribosome biogenesis GTPase
MAEGRIFKALSGFYYVDTGEQTVECRAPGRFRLGKLTPLVGDRVEFTELGEGRGILTSILPRKSYFLRPAVANVELMIIIGSGAPPVTDPFLIDRIAAIAESAGVEPVIVLNKCDLDRADALFHTYCKAGFKTICTSALTGEGIGELYSVLAGKTAVFTGNSGVGKSSILNALDPDFKIATGEVSSKLGRGRHTTRHVELFRLPNGAEIADTPGFSSFDTVELRRPGEIAGLFRDFAPYIGKCRFKDCAHLKEQGCAVTEAVGAGSIGKTRYQSYVRLYEAAKQIPEWER